MTEHRGWLAGLSVARWADLNGLGMAEWLWSDVEGDGIHNAALLPGKPPAQATHVWGWASGRWVRVRVDADLPRGFAGSMLTTLKPEEGSAIEVDVRVTPTPLWPATAGQVSMASLPGVTDRTRYAAIRNAHHVTRASGARSSVVPVTFVELVLGPLPILLPGAIGSEKAPLAQTAKGRRDA